MNITVTDIPLIYDHANNTARPATQNDIDKMNKIIEVQGTIISALRRAWEIYEIQKRIYEEN